MAPAELDLLSIGRGLVVAAGRLRETQLIADALSAMQAQNPS